MNAVLTAVCAAGVLAMISSTGAAASISDEIIITQTGPSDLLQGLPVDITIPETSSENSATVTLSNQSATAFPSFGFSVFLLDQNGPGLISDVVFISGGPSTLSGPPFTITASLISDSEGEILDPIGLEVGRTFETGSPQDLTGFFATPLAGALGAPLPIDIFVSSDVEAPEPATAAMFGVGLLGLFAALRRR